MSNQLPNGRRMMDVTTLKNLGFQEVTEPGAVEFYNGRCPKRERCVGVARTSNGFRTLRASYPNARMEVVH